MKLQIPKKIKVILFPFRYLIAVIPFIWIYNRIDFADFENAFRNVAWWTIPWVLISAFAVIFLNGVRWWVLLRKFASTFTFSQALKTHFVSAYYSVVLPTSFAQDATRIFFTSKHVDYSVVWGAAWIYKLIYFLTWTIISTYGILTLNKEFLPKGSYFVIILFIIVLGLLVILSFSKKVTSPIRSVLEKFLPKKIMTISENIRQGIYDYRNNKTDLYLSIVLTLLIQAIFILGNALVLYGITGKFFLIECLAYLPVIDILCMLLPLTPNSVGIREFFFVYMFKMIGRSNEELGVFITLGLIAYLMKLTGGIPVLVDMVKDPISLRKKK
jgi:uncharacterized protein (TIRG00374 family)